MTRRLRLMAAGTLTALLTIPAVATADEHEEVDGRAHVSFVTGVVDKDGQLWFKVGFYKPWGETPPRDVHSLFFSLEVVVTDEEGERSKEVGWQTHETEESPLGDEGTQAFILDNGCVLVATGLYPKGEYQIVVYSDFASWADPDSKLINDHQDIATSWKFVEQENLDKEERQDPMTFFGTPVFNLTTGQPVGGTASGGATEEPTTSGGGGDEPTTSGGADSGGSASGDGGPSSTGGADLGLLFALVALLTLIFLYWWYGIRPKRYAYRADREVGLDMVEKGPGDGSEADDTSDEQDAVEEEPTGGGVPLTIDEPDTTFEDPCWEQSRKLQDAQTRLWGLEAEKQDTPGSSEETHKALDQAIEHARGNVAAAQKALDECIEAKKPATADTGERESVPAPPSGPASTDESTEFSKDCKKEKAAYAAAVAATDQAKDRRDAAEAAWLEADSALSAVENQIGTEASEADLESARAAESAARAERDASVAAQDAAIDAENEARRALDLCRRVPVSSDDPDDEETDPGGTGSGGSNESASACKEGAEEWRYESQSRRFTVLDGDVRLRISNAPVTWGGWQRANGTATTVSATALQGLDSDQVEALLTPLPAGRRVIPAISIPTKVVRVRCERLWTCRGGQWVATDQLRKNPLESKGQDESFGGRDVSTIGNIVDLLEAVKERLDELDRELEEGRAFECN